MPLPFGVWAGWWSRTERIRLYAVYGAASGVIAFVLAVTLIAVKADFRYDVTTADIDYLARYTLGAALFYVTGGLCGSKLVRRIYSMPMEAPRRLARGILFSTSGATAAGDDGRVQRVANILSAVTPLLTFIGSIVTAYFTYMASIVKR